MLKYHVSLHNFGWYALRLDTINYSYTILGQRYNEILVVETQCRVSEDVYQPGAIHSQLIKGTSMHEITQTHNGIWEYGNSSFSNAFFVHKNFLFLPSGIPLFFYISSLRIICRHKPRGQS